ncbi:LuxR C-terminal-related transcriptional regulator [Iamia majanohamensis]|uniref:LuxR C-terminal-related transcriptional regulator n=1 Tax=Iamia majanohamensis TaxID=467976 RepID=A0AAF0BVI0_9ACTN|nr:LuxR C-terminal-related transcriptional regulator [Iamia majanohamensis]WCO66790.1 LuxR C-terminal-related transcriptional regulator [Iamia majanohamensis]
MGTAVAPGSPDLGALPPFVVARPRLERLLGRVPPGGLGLIVATAGSGKSVLLAQWLAEAPEPVQPTARFAPGDSDAVCCGRRLVAALDAVAPGAADGLGEVVAAGGGSLGEDFVAAFLAALAGIDDGVLLAVDDLHVIENPALVEDLGHLLTRLPGNVRAIVTSRWDPGFAVRQPRLDGRLVELRATDLAFGSDEGRTLVEAVSGQALSDDSAAALVSRTDGWAVGLQLAAVALKGAPDVSAAIDAFAGDDRLVAEYLTAEVLDRQEPEVRRFLLRTSVLEWLSPEVCEAVTEEEGAREMLDVISGRSLFLVPLDRRGERYRYHHLFAELLRLRLLRDDPEAPRRRHRLAARWLLDHGAMEEAIDHLLRAGDRLAVADILSRRGRELYERGESGTLVRWLDAIVTAEPHPPATAALDLLGAQVGADASAGASRTYRDLCLRDDLSAEERATAHAFYAVLAHCDLPPDEVQRATDAVATALPHLDASAMPQVLGVGGLASVEALAQYGAAVARFHRGRDRARGGFDALLSLEALRYPVWRVNALGWASVEAAWDGRCTEAVRHAQAALALAREASVVHHVSAALSHMALATVALERGDHEEAGRSLDKADLCTRRSQRATYRDLQRLVRARHLAATQGPWAGLDALRRPVGVGGARGLFVAAADGLEASLLIKVGRLTQAETVLRRAADEPATLPARIDHRLASADAAGARRLLATWRPEPRDLRGQVQHGIRTAVVLDLEGSGEAAGVVLAEAVDRAAAEGLRQPFRSVPAALALLRGLPHGGRHSFAASILDLPVEPDVVRAVAGAMVEPLTEREQGILVRLPTRLSNTDIAAELFISVNTLKTHLRNIYRKLGVGDRDAAVARATELGLL